MAGWSLMRASTWRARRGDLVSLAGAGTAESLPTAMPLSQVPAVVEEGARRPLPTTWTARPPRPSTSGRTRPGDDAAAFRRLAVEFTLEALVPMPAPPPRAGAPRNLRAVHAGDAGRRTTRSCWRVPAPRPCAEPGGAHRPCRAPIARMRSWRGTGPSHPVVFAAICRVSEATRSARPWPAPRSKWSPNRASSPRRPARGHRHRPVIEGRCRHPSMSISPKATPDPPRSRPAHRAARWTTAVPPPDKGLARGFGWGGGQGLLAAARLADLVIDRETGAVPASPPSTPRSARMTRLRFAATLGSGARHRPPHKSAESDHFR